MSWVRCHHWVVQRRGRWRRTLWAWWTWWDHGPLLQEAQGVLRRAFCPWGWPAYSLCLPPTLEPPPPLAPCLRASPLQPFLLPCTDPQSGQGPSHILLSLCLCPEGRAVSRLGLFTSVPGPQQLLSLANSYTTINSQPSSAGKPGSE